MTRLRVLLVRLVAMVRGERREAELSDEIDLHLDLLAQEHRRKGLSEEDARSAARREFGGVLHVQEEYRQQQRLPAIDALVQDVRFALRVLWRERTSTLVAISLLALGVGATVVMADLLDRLLLRPPAHVSSPERVARVYTAGSNERPSAMITNYVMVEHLATGTRGEVEFMAAYQNEQLGLGRGPDARRLNVVTHSRAYFDVLGVEPALGTLPSSREAGIPDAAVVSHGLWESAFGRASDVLGRTLSIGKRIYTVVAVTPRGFAGIDADAVDVWLPLESRGDETLQPGWRTGIYYFGLRVIARLRTGVDRPTAEAHASAVYRSGPLPEYMPRATRILFGELPAARAPGGDDNARVVRWSVAVAGLVLLIACGNVGNLLLVSGLRRGRELALKTALGATRGRLIREVLIEAAVLAFGAGIVGLVVVLTAGALIRELLLPPIMATISPLDGRLVVITVGVCLAAAFGLGTIPALRLTSRRILMPGRALQSERSSRMLDAFVAVQVALSVPLIIGASLFALSLWQARQVDFGLDATNVAVVSMRSEEVGTPAENHLVHRRIAEHLRRLPQVDSAALIHTVPMRMVSAVPTEVPGAPERDAMAEGPYVNAVDPEFFSTIGRRFVMGRPFTSAENVDGGRPVVVVDETMARVFWPDQSPLGKCVKISGLPCAEVIGVVASAVTWPRLGAQDARPPFIYIPIEQYANELRDGRKALVDRAILVRTRDSIYGSLALLRREAQATGSQLPYIDVWAFDDVFQPTLRPLRLGATVFVAFGLLGLIIASVGLAAVTAYSVTRRTRELGIRLVLGAEPGTLVYEVLRRSLAAVALGLIAGGLLAWAGGRGLRAVLFGVSPDDPRVYAAAAAVLIVVSLIAAYLPARRAGRVEPAVVLRTE